MGKLTLAAALAACAAVDIASAEAASYRRILVMA